MGYTVLRVQAYGVIGMGGMGYMVSGKQRCGVHVIGSKRYGVNSRLSNNADIFPNH